MAIITKGMKFKCFIQPELCPQLFLPTLSLLSFDYVSSIKVIDSEDIFWAIPGVLLHSFSMLQTNGSQPRTTRLLGDICQYLEMFWALTTGEGKVLLVSSGQSLKILLNILRCIGHFYRTQQSGIAPDISSVKVERLCLDHA